MFRKFRGLVSKVSKTYRNIRDFNDKNLCFYSVNEIKEDSTIEYLLKKGYIQECLTTIGVGKKSYLRHYIYTEKGGVVSSRFTKAFGFN